MHNDPFHNIHVLAALLALGTLAYTANDLAREIVALGVMGKYGLLVSIVISWNGIRNWISEVRSWFKD